MSGICNLTGKECPYNKCIDDCPEAKNARIRYMFELKRDLYMKNDPIGDEPDGKDMDDDAL